VGGVDEGLEVGAYGQRARQIPKGVSEIPEDQRRGEGRKPSAYPSQR
jgi:hypothetical protein